MDLQAEKNWIKSELDKINDKSLIQTFKSLLDFARKKNYTVKHEPMSLDEFYKRIEESENDIKKGKTKTHAEVKKVINSWKKRS
jgi:hypothetical protein